MSEIKVTLKGVRKLLTKLTQPSSETCRPDKIPTIILGECADDLETLLCIVFN